MTPAEITALIGLITTLLPAGVTLVNDIRSLFQSKSITPDQLTALIALIGQDVANNTADTMKTAQADMALNTGATTGSATASPDAHIQATVQKAFAQEFGKGPQPLK